MWSTVGTTSRDNLGKFFSSDRDSLDLSRPSNRTPLSRSSQQSGKDPVANKSRLWILGLPPWHYPSSDLGVTFSETKIPRPMRTDPVREKGRCQYIHTLSSTTPDSRIGTQVCIHTYTYTCVQTHTHVCSQTYVPTTHVDACTHGRTYTTRVSFVVEGSRSPLKS